MTDEERVAAEQRERLRAERKKERERDMRMDVSWEHGAAMVLLLRRTREYSRRLVAPAGCRVCTPQTNELGVDKYKSCAEVSTYQVIPNKSVAKALTNRSPPSIQSSEPRRNDLSPTSQP